ncbi:MAG: extracellular solute-binding protein [Clostridiales bacterium]|nr:extracellular solute-binding protein [Clostridiales bacterium]
MKKVIRSLLAVTLVTGMALPVAACRKSSRKTESTTKVEESDPTKKTGTESNTDKDSDTKPDQPEVKTLKANEIRTIQEDDPYYEIEKNELQLSPIPGVEFATTDFNLASIVGDKILVNVNVTLKESSDTDALFAHNYLAYDDYEFHGLQLFDMNGRNIATIPMEENCEFRRAFAMSNGEILVATDKFDYNVCKSTPYFFVISASGEKLREFKVDCNETIYNMQPYPVENGNLFIASEQKLFLFDSEGKLIKKNEGKTLGAFMNYSDGKWYVAHVAPPSYNIGAFQEVDINTGELKDSFKADTSITPYLTDSTNCLIYGEMGVQKYNIEQSTTTQVLSPMSANLNCSYLKEGQILDDNTMRFLYVVPDRDNDKFGTDCYCYFANTMSILTLKRTDKNPNAGKELVKVALYVNDDPYLRDKIMEYNLDPANHGYIEFYSVTDDETVGWSDDVLIQLLGRSSKLVTEDMYEGDGPDILVGYSSLADFNGGQYMIDMKPYLQADTTINKDDYFYNIFEAFEKDGKLYSLPLTFTLRGMAVNSSIAGAKEKWTFDDFNKIKNSLPASMSIMPEYSCAESLSLFLTASTSDFIDYEKGEANFESEEFKTLLETIKNNASANPDMNDGVAMINGQLMAATDQLYYNKTGSILTSLNTFEDYCILAETATSDKMLFAGYPSKEGKSMTARAGLSMSITSCAANPDVAWEFIRYLLNEDVQKYMSVGNYTLPVSKKAFEATSQEQIALSESATEEFLNNPNYGAYPIQITAERKDDFEKLLSSIDNSHSLDSEITAVVIEEADRYFGGWQTLDNVAKIIQAKATDILRSR